jgi:tight adherence protein B
MLQELIPIIILIGIAFAALAVAIILKVRSKKSLLLESKDDFIDEIIAKKKRQINANIGGISWGTYTALMVLAPIGLGMLGFIILDHKAFCVVFALAGLFVPEVVARISAKKQQKKFEEKYAMALRSLASGLRAGLSIEQAIDNVGQNPFLEAKIRDGFRQISADLKFGIPLEETFLNFARDSGSKDAFDVAAVISMQAKVGGSEATAIGTIVQNISNRIMTRNEIKALFADTDMLILIMDFLPVGLFLLLYFGAPEMVAPFLASTGMTILLIAILAFSVIGSFVIHKISKSAKEG